MVMGQLGAWIFENVSIPFFDDIVENLHHCNRLIFSEALSPEALDKLESVEVVVSLTPCRRVEGCPGSDYRLARLVRWPGD